MVDKELENIDAYDFVRIAEHDDGYTLVFKGSSSSFVDLSEGDLERFYSWLAKNVGPFGEGWKSIADDEATWPQYMDRDDLYELAEAQQKIISELQMDDEATEILRDIRDILQDIRGEQKRAETTTTQFEAVHNKTEAVEELEGETKSLNQLRQDWMQAVSDADCELTPEQWENLASDVREADSAVEVAEIASNYIARCSDESEFSLT